MKDGYVYPNELYCVDCSEDVQPIVEERIDGYVKDGVNVNVPCRIAVCPICGRLLCDRDADYAVVRAAKRGE